MGMTTAEIFERAIELARKQTWLNHEEKELYAGAVYLAMMWAEKVS